MNPKKSICTEQTVPVALVEALWPTPWSYTKKEGDTLYTVAVISSSPNAQGLTAACVQAASEGIENGGGVVLAIDLNQAKFQTCAACGNGSGTCRNEGYCQVEDDFQQLHKQVVASDALIIVTPVYWGEMSESAKAFFDRLRRCEAYKRELSALAKKPVIAVAAAGGSGNGTISCLGQMERLIQHVQASFFDYIPVMRRNRSYKMQVISSAAKAMLELLHEAQ